MDDTPASAHPLHTTSFYFGMEDTSARDPSKEGSKHTNSPFVTSRILMLASAEDKVSKLASDNGRSDLPLKHVCHSCLSSVRMVRKALFNDDSIKFNE